MTHSHSAARAALERLRAGNLRFVSGESERSSTGSKGFGVIETQEPFAAILGCADSRVPAELIFDQGLGDLFVVRVAGNIVAPSLVGSVEFAAAQCGTRLVVVLGHTQCGAVQATIEAIASPETEHSRNLAAVVDRIRPAVQGLIDGEGVPTDPQGRRDLTNRAVRANVRASVNRLCQGSKVLKRFIRDEELVVVGAEYSLETGEVDFFDGVPTDA